MILLVRLLKTLEEFMYAFSGKSSLRGEFIVPGSKSQTIRAVLMALLADGKSVIHNPQYGNDGQSAYHAAEQLGAKIVKNDSEWIVQGCGGIPSVPENIIDTVNSGTTTSFVSGICSLLDGYAVITGDEQIRRRPIRPELEALAELGAAYFITRKGCDCPPVVIGGKMHGGKCHLPGYNSQHVSGILVPAALIPAGETVEIEVAEPREVSYIQMTIDWMKKYGVIADKSDNDRFYYVAGGQKYKAAETWVSSDWSAVAFPLVAAVCTNSDIVINGVNFNDPQGDKRVVDILISMGADIVKDTAAGRLIVHGGRSLNGNTEINMNDIPDALPVLAVAASYAEGETRFTTLAHVRIKESDRVAVMCEELSKCGADIRITDDSMIIRGGKRLHGDIIDSRRDHRIAMAMTVCGFFADGRMTVKYAECADVSFPGFYDLMKSAGADINLQ